MEISTWEKRKKIENFPPLNFISVTDSIDRRDLLYKNCEDYGITNIRPHIFERYDDSKHKFIGQSYKNYSVNELGRAPVTSHLKAIKEWFFDTDEDYAFFCEDDISFDTIQYWNFTWNDFFENLPKDWECIQLCWVRENNMFMFSHDGLKIRNRCWCDWSGCAYLIKRSHAKKLISNYYINGEFNLDYVGDDLEVRSHPENSWSLTPCIETIIFSNFSKIYGFPLFVENVYQFQSTLHFVDQTRPHNFYSYDTIMDWWKTVGKDTPISEIMVLK